MAAELERLETEAQKEVKAKGWAWIGVRRLTTMSAFRRARSFEPLRARNPTFAVGRGQREAFFHAVAELRAFRNAYKVALALWRSGTHDVVFPAGTLAMRIVHGVRVAPG